jgi:tetratricopeptide (TPR) repeat protein
MWPDGAMRSRMHSKVNRVCCWRMLRTLCATLYLLIGKLMGRLRHYQSALRYFKFADSLHPNSLTAKCWIGWAHQQLDNQKEALSAFEEALQVNPSWGYAHAQMGRCLADLGQYQRAVDELLRASRIEPKYEARREYLLVLGSAYSHLNLMTESLAAYEKAYRLFPGDAEVVYGYGWALCTSKKFAEAEQVLREAISLDLKRPDAHYNLAVSLGAQDKWSEAAHEFRQTIALNPKRSDAHCGLGTAYKELQQFKEAVVPLSEAIRISTDDPDAYAQIGVVYSELREWEAAVEAGKKLRQLLPDNEIGFWIMSSAYAELERYAEAMEVTEANLRHNPNSSPAIEGLGYIYLKSGRFTEAVPVYKRAITAHAGAAYLHAQLAEAYLGIGDIAGAEEQHRTLASLDNSMAEGLRKRIRERSVDAGEVAAN